MGVRNSKPASENPAETFLLWPGKGRVDKGLRHSPAIWGAAVTPLQNQPPSACLEVTGNPGAAGSQGVRLCVNTDPGSSDLRV